MDFSIFNFRFANCDLRWGILERGLAMVEQVSDLLLEFGKSRKLFHRFFGRFQSIFNFAS